MNTPLVSLKCQNLTLTQWKCFMIYFLLCGIVFVKYVDCGDQKLSTGSSNTPRILFKGRCDKSQSVCKQVCLHSNLWSNEFYCACIKGFQLDKITGRNCHPINISIADSHLSREIRKSGRPPELEMEIFIDNDNPDDKSLLKTMKPNYVSLPKSSPVINKATSSQIHRVSKQTFVSRTRRSSTRRITARSAVTQKYTSRQSLGTQCTSAACQNGGLCRSTTDINHPVYCLCPLGFTGLQCEKEADSIKYPEFELEGGYLKFLPRGYRDDEFRITLEIRPGVSKAVLLYQRSFFNQVFLLAIEDEIVVFRFGNQNGTQELRSKKRIDPYGDPNRWYRIEIERQKNVGKLRVDNEELQPFGKSDKSVALERDNFIYLGGHPSLTQHYKWDSLLFRLVDVSFIGCVKTLKINGREVDMRRAPYVGEAVSGLGIQDCAKRVCINHGCKHNGTCHVSSPDSYICRCPLNYNADQFCKKDNKVTKMPNFESISYMKYVGLKSTSKSQTNVRIVFKPNTSTGILLYQGYSKDRRGDFLAITLYNGHVEVTYDLGTGPVTLRSRMPLKLQQWHQVQFRRKGRQGILTVNDQVRVIDYSKGGQVQLTLNEDLFLGGHENYDHVSYFMSLRTGFFGCIQTLHLNGKSIDLIKDAKLGVNIKNCNSHVCAHELDPCADQGECVARKNEYKCFCWLGYTDKYCQSELKTKNIHEPSFTGDSYLLFNDQRYLYSLSSQGFRLSISIRIQGGKDRGLLLYLTAKRSDLHTRFLMIKVTGNYQLSVSANDGWGEKTYANLCSFKPNKFFKLEIERLMGQYKFSIDGTLQGLVEPPQENIEPTKFSSLLIGGTDISTSAQLNLPDQGGIHGCIRSIMLDNEIIKVENAKDGRIIDQCKNNL